MSAYYDLYQSPPDENGESVCLHARILPRGTISAGKFRELVAKATGFSPAILDGTLQAVTDELCSWLSEGWTVEVGELGYFSVSLKCDRQVTDKKEISVGTFSKCEPAPREQIPQPFQYDGAGTQSVAVRIPFLDGRGGTQGKIIAAFE